MRITVKGTVVDDDGSTFETDIELDWEQVRLNRETNERHVYGNGDVWFTKLPARAAPHKSKAQ